MSGLKQSRHQDILDALLQQLPGSGISAYRERDWHSLTFEGRQVAFAINIESDIAAVRIEQFMREIGEMELPAKDYFVADISATLTSASRIEMEMLLIRE